MMAAARTGDAEKIARQMIEYRPTFAPAWGVLGLSGDDPVETEAALRKALWLEPCRANNYLSVAAFPLPSGRLLAGDLGGITLENARDVLNAGADSVAVIAGLLPESPTAQSLRQRMEQCFLLVTAD